MCLLRIYRASVGRYTRCGYCQERTSSHWRDDVKPFSRVASFQGTPVHKDSAVTAPTAQSANRIYAIADSFLAIAFQNTWAPKTAACFQRPPANVRPRGRMAAFSIDKLPLSAKCGHSAPHPIAD